MIPSLLFLSSATVLKVISENERDNIPTYAIDLRCWNRDRRDLEFANVR